MIQNALPQFLFFGKTNKHDKVQQQQQQKSKRNTQLHHYMLVSDATDKIENLRTDAYSNINNNHPKDMKICLLCFLMEIT